MSRSTGKGKWGKRLHIVFRIVAWICAAYLILLFIKDPTYSPNRYALLFVVLPIFIVEATNLVEYYLRKDFGREADAWIRKMFKKH